MMFIPSELHGERPEFFAVFLHLDNQLGDAGGRGSVVAPLDHGLDVFFFPFDFGFIVKRTLRLVRPRLFIMMETEIWPNLLRACHRQGVRTLVVNGRISSRSYPRYRLARPLFEQAVHLGLGVRFPPVSERFERQLSSLKARGLRVLAVARSERRLELARAMGAAAVATTAGAAMGAAGTPSMEAARGLSGREGVDLVVETAGTAEAVEQAVELARPGGRVVLTGLPHEPSSLHFFWVVRRELRLIGSMIYQDEFPEAIRLLASGAVRTERLLTHRFPLEAIQDAFVAHRSPESIKVAVIP